MCPAHQLPAAPAHAEWVGPRCKLPEWRSVIEPSRHLHIAVTVLGIIPPRQQVHAVAVHNCLMVATAMGGFALHCAHLLHSAPAAGRPGQLQGEGPECMCLGCYAEGSRQPSCMRHLVPAEECHRLSVASEGLMHECSALSSWTTADIPCSQCRRTDRHTACSATLEGSSRTTHVFVFTLTMSSRKVYGPAPASFWPQPMKTRMMWGFLGWITAA